MDGGMVGAREEKTPRLDGLGYKPLFIKGAKDVLPSTETKSLLVISLLRGGCKRIKRKRRWCLIKIQ
jgi:hypothetical protein